ncbi:MAG: hypothetical protein RLY78_43 [Pseudomonadota bacterium]|jgi:hypothetical protein
MRPYRPFRFPAARSVVAAAALLACAGAASAQSSYLQSLVDATAAGSWTQVNAGALSSSFVTDPSLLPTNLIYTPENVVHAWSSVAWDSLRGNLMLWGGGHSSHSGNEMYLWSGSSGNWSLGSLPSAVINAPDSADADNRTYLVADNAAPQSSHTYEGNLYLPLNDRFITFGGVAFNDAQGFTTRDASGALVTAGPWLYDPSKASATQVGGTTGSGWDSTTTGGQMWTNRVSSVTWIGTAPASISFINNTTAYREENGHDVVYLTAYSGGGWPSLYRYTVGNLAAGEGDTFELIGVSSNVPSLQASGTIDDTHSLYVHTTTHPSTTYDLNVWDLTQSGSGNADVGISLVLAGTGAAFDIDENYAVEWNSADGYLYLWGGDGGQVYRTKATYNADGSLATTWTLESLLSAGSEPEGSFRYGVLGKWTYVESLGVFVALDEYDTATGDAGVWIYKPDTYVPTAGAAGVVPEPATVAMMLAGLGVVGARVRRTRRG